MVSDIELLSRCHVWPKILVGCFCITRFWRVDYQSRISGRVRFERVVDFVLWRVTIYKIARINLADEVLLKYVVNILVLVDGEDVP